jgi:hypothetical protein
MKLTCSICGKLTEFQIVKWKPVPKERICHKCLEVKYPSLFNNKEEGDENEG